MWNSVVEWMTHLAMHSRKNQLERAVRNIVSGDLVGDLTGAKIIS